jgi:hypothetical protein
VAAVFAASLVLACSGGDSKGKGDGAAPVGVTTAEATALNLPSPSGATFTAGVGVSDANIAAGWSTTPGGARAVSWTLTGGQPPATVGEHLPIAGNTHSAAYAVGGGGNVVGESQKGSTTVAVVWPGGSPTPTELSLTNFSAPAAALAASGNLIVGQATSGGRTVAVIWTTPTATPVELGTIDSDGTSRAYAIAASGLVVGEASDKGALRGAVWEIDATGDVVDGPDPLAPLAGDVKSVAFGAFGETIVGESEAANGTVRAVRWTRDADTKNISAPVALGAGSASGVAGPLAVGQSAQQAALWDLATSSPASLLAAAPSQALGINASGAIVGFSGSGAFLVPGGAIAPTGVTLVADKQSPQITGAQVVWTAEGLGATGFEYQFWLNTAGSWALVRDYGADASWTMPAQPAGFYQVAVYARTAPGNDVNTVANFRFVPAVNPPATSVTLAPDQQSPHVQGTAVIWTATPVGGSGHEYEFWLNTGGTWALVQNYGPSATWTMPANQGLGTYQVAVYVRTAPGNDVNTVANYRIVSSATPPQSVTLAPNLPSPRAQGTSVTWTATPVGGADHEYQFWLNTAGTWSLVRDYAPTATWTMEGLAAGNYQVTVYVRTSPTNAINTVANYTIIPAFNPPAAALTLSPTQPSPHPQGSAVDFRAEGFGSTGYQYQFWLNTNGTWAMVQDFSSDDTWTMPADQAIGTYQVAAYVHTGALVEFDVPAVVTYQVTAQ